MSHLLLVSFSRTQIIQHRQRHEQEKTAALEPAEQEQQKKAREEITTKRTTYSYMPLICIARHSRAFDLLNNDVHHFQSADYDDGKKKHEEAKSETWM